MGLSIRLDGGEGSEGKRWGRERGKNNFPSSSVTANSQICTHTRSDEGRKERGISD